MKTVILLHGLHMHSWSLFYLIKKFRMKKDVDVKTFGYHSTLYSDKLLDKLQNLIDNQPAENEIFLIGHSMGGLIAKKYIQRKNPDRKITLITLGAPHNGAKIGKFISKSPLKFMLGSSGNSGITEALPEWDKNSKHELICIAGIGNFGPSQLLLNSDKRPSDGTVFLDEAIDKNCNIKIIIEDMIHTQLIASERTWHHLEQLIFKEKDMYGEIKSL